jgi:hypothetical protein
MGNVGVRRDKGDFGDFHDNLSLDEDDDDLHGNNFGLHGQDHDHLNDTELDKRL